jgi:hypothetical protein
MSRLQSSVVLNPAVLNVLTTLPPLSLACLIGSPSAVSILLESMTEKLTYVTYRQSYGDEGAGCPLHPIFCCALMCQHDCLDIIRKHMGAKEFNLSCQLKGMGISN